MSELNESAVFDADDAANGDEVETADRGLVDRDEEFELIDARIDAAGQGAGAAVLIEGDAGSGKTVLLEAVTDRLDAEGFQVLSAHGRPAELPPPFGGLEQLFGSSLDDLERAEGEVGLRASRVRRLIDDGTAWWEAPGDRAYSMMNDLYWLTLKLGSERPLALVVDDLHWLDTQTARFVVHLVARIQATPILIVCTTRGNTALPSSELVRRLACHPHTTTVRPRPLTADGLARMVARAYGQEPEPAFLDTLVTTTAGNPSLVGEVLTRLGPTPTDGEDRLMATMPACVAEMVLGELSSLTDDCRTLARAVATLGPHTDLSFAAEVTGMSTDRVGVAANLLATAAIFRRTGPLGFEYPIVREAVYSAISEADRADLHRRCAAVLEARGATASELAPHLIEAAASGPDASRVFRAAAQEAIGQGAASLALRYLQLASEAAGQDGPDPDLEIELAQAEWLNGDIRQAASRLAGVEAGGGRRALMLARALFTAGDPVGAVDALDAVEPGQREREVILALSESPDDPFEDPLARAVVEFRRGTDEAASKLALTAYEGGEWRSRPPDMPSVLALGWVLIQTEHLHEAQRFALHVLDLAMAEGSVVGYSTARALLAGAAWCSGDVKAARLEAEAGLRVSPPHDAVARPWLATVLALSAIEQADIDAAGDALAALGDQEPAGTVLDAQVWTARIAHARAAGSLVRAAAGEAAVARTEAELGIANPQSAWRLDAVRAARVAGEVDQAKVVADEMTAAADAFGGKRQVALAMLAQAIAASDAADAADAVSQVVESGTPLELAGSLIDLGRIQGEAGMQREARLRLREGIELARQCGSQRLVDVGVEELRRAGGRVRRLAASGTESLTRSELRVAAAVSRGLTNREVAEELYVTPKTVENHLSKIYSKLSISNRSELAAALGEVAVPPLEAEAS